MATALKKTKRNPPNAFMMYCFDRKRQVEQEGETIEGGTPGLVARFGDEWRDLPKEVREPYETKAKNAKAAMRENRVAEAQGGAPRPKPEYQSKGNPNKAYTVLEAKVEIGGRPNDEDADDDGWTTKTFGAC